MEKRNKVYTKDGLELNCNVIMFFKGIYEKEIVVYTVSDNDDELLASYYSVNNNKITLSEINDEKEWENIEKTFNELHNKLKKQ